TCTFSLCLSSAPSPRRMGHSRVGFAAGLPRLRFGWWLGRLINLAGGDEVVGNLFADLPSIDGVLAVVVDAGLLGGPEDAVAGVVEPEIGASAGSGLGGKDFVKDFVRGRHVASPAPDPRGAGGCRPVRHPMTL